MCALLRMCLENEREAIMNDLRPKYILPRLVKDAILTEEEKSSILSHSDVDLQVKELCDILPSKGLSAFNSLIYALNEDGAYPWLAEKLIKQKKDISLSLPDEVSNDIKKQLAIGGVPFPTNHLLQRKEKLEEIRDKLRKASALERQWVTLHGMVGSGKSVLAAEAVRDPKLFRECFEDGVFWIPIGKLKNQSNLLYRMQILYGMLKSSSVSHSQNDITLDLTPQVQALKRNLTEAVTGKKMLVVLDDVWSSSLINAFDVGCPILVTTRDMKALELVTGYTEFIHLNKGLNLTESKDLLCMYVKTDPDLLPKEAEEIHDRCWGSPMILSLVGAMMAPYGNNEERWKNLNKKLGSGQIKILTGRRQRHPSTEESHKKNLKEIIKLSVDSLDEELRHYFMDFAIFQEDVRIPNKVLEVIWQFEKCDVEDIVYELVEKSFIQREEKQSKNTFAYAVHDLYLELLKDECRDTKGLHKKMIREYRKLCQTVGDQVKHHDYGFLPDDGYIYYFIGYHLQQAEEWDLFPEIYFDLEFLKNKICIAGASDLLNDYHFYEQGFSKVLEEWHDFESFVKKNAHLINEDTDMIQLALLEPPHSKVHQKAKCETAVNPKRFYLEMCNTHHVYEYDELHITLHCKAVHCAVFCPDNRFIACAGDDAILKVCSSSSGREFVSYTGHSGVINCCAVNSSGNRLISSSSDKTVKVWRINNKILERCLSQEKKRYCYGETHGTSNDSESECLLTFKEHHGEVLSCAFSYDDDEMVVSGDSNGVTLVWDPTSGNVKSVLAFENACARIHSCAFSFDSKLVASSSNEFIRLWDCSACSVVMYLGELSHDDALVCGFCFTKDSRFIFSVAGESIRKWSLTGHPDLLKKINLETNLYSCSLSPDEKFLALGTSPNNSVVIWNIDSEKVVTFLKKHKDVINSISYSNDGSRLLTASSDSDVIVWNDVIKRLLNPFIGLENNLSVRFLDELTIAASDHLNHVQVFSGYEGLLKRKSPSDVDQITACSLSNDCSEVIYGTYWGAVKVFRVNSGKVSQCLPSHLSRISYIVHAESFFVTCSEDHTLRIWESPDRYRPLESHKQPVVMCVLYASDKKLLSCSADGTAKVWDTQQGKVILELAHENELRINFCDVSPDEKFLATASADCTIRLWCAENGNLIETFKCNGHVRCCKFSPKADFLVSGEDSGSVMVWDLMCSSGRRMEKNHDSWVKKIQFSKDGKFFASVADSICFWDEEASLIQKLVLPGDLAYSLWACHDFTTFVILHNSMLYILKAIF